MFLVTKPFMQEHICILHHFRSKNFPKGFQVEESKTTKSSTMGKPHSLLIITGFFFKNIYTRKRPLSFFKAYLIEV